MFARRPGTQSCEIDYLENRLLRVFTGRPGRHFYGHGCYSVDGRHLFATENDYEAGQGVVTVREVETLTVLGEYSSHGIGPHELRLLPDGRTLVVANGGIRTHPDSGRHTLNPDTMAPNLAYLDVASGRLLDSYRLADQLLSIRHLDVTPDGVVGIAMQYQSDVGSGGDSAPLAALHRGRNVEVLTAPHAVWIAANAYAGDIAIDPVTGTLAITCPRGDRVLFWDVAGGDFRGTFEMHQPAGIAVLSGQFAVSNELGQILFIDPVTLQEEPDLARLDYGVMWDNHFTAAT